MTRDILIFIGISSAILAIVFAVIFIIIKAIIKFVISLFKKEPQPHQMEGALVDKGKDLAVNVEALEKSKMQRATMQYNQPVSQKKAEEQIKIDVQQSWDKKSEQDIIKGLGKLKNEPLAPDEKSEIPIKLKPEPKIDMEKVAQENPKQFFEKPKTETEAVKTKEPVKKDTSFFKGREGVKMREAAYEIARKTSPYLKGGLGGTYTLKERQEIAKKITDFKKYGTLLQKSDKSKILYNLQKEKIKASPSERVKIQKQERFIKNIFK